MMRGINSRNEQHVPKYCKKVIHKCNEKGLDERMASLLAKTSLNDVDIAELEAIDRTLIKILVQTDQQYRPLTTAPWSPEIQMAYMTHRYWSLKLTAKRTERNLNSALKAIAARLDPALTTQDPNRSLSPHLKQAQKKLKEARSEAAKNRKKHLEALLNQAIASNQQKKSKAIKYLIRAERNRQCYARFCQHTKPKSAGGLAFVTVTTNGEKQPILERSEMEETLLEYSRLHFAKAEGSPFTNEPLNRLLQYDGLTSFGNRITQGRPLGATYQFDEPTTAILQNLKQKITPDHPQLNMDYETLLEGIKKWPE